jgi:murein DD-endopeptidase MepM/ murein hydrolase activator NlpD
LEFLFITIVLLFAFPHSKINQNFDYFNFNLFKKTIFYSLVPETENFPEVEEVIVDPLLARHVQPPSWKDNAFVSENLVSTENKMEIKNEPTLALGGRAILNTDILNLNQKDIITSTVDNLKLNKIFTHSVVSGETLSSIASKYNLKIETILWSNNLTSKSYIRPGQNLTILPIDGITYSVKRGDTVSKIAANFGVKTDDILKYNNLSSSNPIIAIGEKIIVPGGKQTARSINGVIKPTNILNNVIDSGSLIAGGNYIWPTSVKRITQSYGFRGHTGVDIAGPIGTPLYATKSGKVTKSQCGWNGGYGCYIIIDHGGGVTSLYGHASQLNVSYGDKVEQGDIIALMGSTGRSTGPHIHFEIRINGKRTNPLKYVK